MSVVELPIELHRTLGGRPPRRQVLLLTIMLLVVAGGAAIWLRRDPPPVDPLPDDLGLASPPQADFLDIDHGYVLLGRCPAPTCEAWAGVTHDGGQTWHTAILPGLRFSRDEGISARLIALDDQHAVLEGYENSAVVDVVPPELATIRPPSGRRWYTSDGGHTWTRVAPDPVAAVDEIPVGAQVTTALGADRHRQIVLRLIRLDGTSAVLAAPPTVPHNIEELDGILTTAPDGSYWVVARGEGTTTVVVSRDRGRTWSALPWPAGHPAPGHRYDFYAGDGVTVYLADTGSFRVWRSSDAGATWEELTVPFSSGIPDTGLRAASLPDGRLLVFQPLNLLFVTTSGPTFEPADPALAFLPSGRVLAPSGDGTPGLAGADGSWRPLPFACLGERCSW
jgi:hypothetical protein